MIYCKINQEELLKFIKGDDYFINEMISFLWFHAICKNNPFARFLYIPKVFCEKAQCYVFEQIDVKTPDETNFDKYIYIYRYFLKDETPYPTECKISFYKHKEDYAIVEILKDYKNITKNFCEFYSLKSILILKSPNFNLLCDDKLKNLNIFPAIDKGYLFGIGEFLKEYQLKNNNIKYIKNKKKEI